MSKLKSLEPKKVFHFFEEISAIPHGSFHTKAISSYLADFAKQRGLEYYQDDGDNVVIIKEASPGYETAPALILQGHMDMVCEKESDCDIDFEKEGLELYVEGDFLRARGTTLGADDGIAVAYGLAVLDSDDICHPRLEVVFTTNEEVGLLGAKDIDLSMLKGNILLNIDSDVEGHFLTACAGGVTVLGRIPVARQEVEGVGISIKIRGLLGGHSGSEIHREHCNAAIAMGRILKCLEESIPLAIYSLSGGLKDNAIPREAQALVVVPEESAEDALGLLHRLEPVLQKEYEMSEPELDIQAEVLEKRVYPASTPSSTQKILFFLRMVPNGVMHMSRIMENLVETSLNLGIMKLSQDVFEVSNSVRSSVESRKKDIMAKVCYLVEFLGGEVETEGDYPPWEYQRDSLIREQIKKVYRDVSGKEPVFEAIHAGLECGIFSDKIPNLDAVSFGPDNFDIHTPKEHLSISSTRRVWEFLVRLMESMKSGSKR